MKRVARIARFLFTAAILATLGILLLLVPHPVFASAHTESPAELVLGHVIDHAEFQRVPFDEAVMQLVNEAGGRVEFDDFVTGDSHLYAPVSCTVKHLTLSQALKILLDAAQDDCDISSSPDGDRVRIKLTNAPPAEPLVVKEYLLPEVVGSSSTPPAPQMSEFGYYDTSVGYKGVERSLGLLSGQDPYGCLVIVPPHLLILGTESSHLVYTKLFTALQPGASADDRRALPPGTELFDLVDGRFLPRERYPARDALRSVFPGFKLGPKSLEEALASLAKQTGVKIVLDDDEVESFPKVKFDAKSITLANAIDSLLRQVSPNVGSFAAEGDVVRVTPKLVPNALRVYNLHAYLSGLPPAAREAGAAKLAESLNGERTDYLGRSLVVRGSWTRLEETEASLIRMVSGRPPVEGGKAQ